MNERNLPQYQSSKEKDMQTLINIIIIIIIITVRCAGITTS
jgi:hypothetical protein